MAFYSVLWFDLIPQASDVMKCFPATEQSIALSPY